MEGIQVSHKTAAMMVSASAVALSAMAPVVAQETDDVIIVRGTAQERYVVDETNVGRIQQDILDAARSVVVIPEQIILDQQIEDLNDALRNAPGATASDGFGGTLDDFSLRGFRRDAIYRNGILLSQATLNKPPLQNIENIEILLGPASVGYGQIQPGGLVNINTKKPSYDTRIFGQYTFGEYGKNRATFDATGPIGNSDKIAYRFNASYEDSDSFRDFFELKQKFFSPSLQFDFTDASTLILTYEYYNDNRPVDRGFVGFNDENGNFVIPDFPIGRRFGDRLEERDSEVNLFEVDYRYAFSDNVSARIGALYREEEEFDIQVRPRILVGDTLLRRVSGSNDRNIETFAVNAQVDTSFTAGATQTDLALGIDFREEEANRFFGNGATSPDFFLDIFNPVYDVVFDDRDPNTLGFVNDVENTWGAYVSGQTEISSFIINYGLRYDSTRQDGENNNRPLEVDDASKVSPSLGIVYQPTDTLSFYGSYAEGFNASNQVNTIPGGDNEPDTLFISEPETSVQYEAGVKARLLGDNLVVTASYFDLTKDNVISSFVSDAPGEDPVPELLGEVQSTGVELTATGAIAGVNIIASYAYIDNEILEGDLAGNTLPNVAENTFSAWASYEQKSGMFAGLGGGLGVFYTDERFGDDPNEVPLDAYTLVDAAAWYYLPLQRLGMESDSQLRFGVNVRNLTDERYFPAGGGDAVRINVGAPRTVLGSIGIEF